MRVSLKRFQKANLKRMGLLADVALIVHRALKFHDVGSTSKFRYVINGNRRMKKHTYILIEYV